MGEAARAAADPAAGPRPHSPAAGPPTPPTPQVPGVAAGFVSAYALWSVLTKDADTKVG